MSACGRDGAHLVACYLPPAAGKPALEQGQALFAVSGQQKAFVRVPGGGHNDLPDRGLYADVWRFLGLQSD